MAENSYCWSILNDSGSVFERTDGNESPLFLIEQANFRLRLLKESAVLGGKHNIILQRETPFPAERQNAICFCTVAIRNTEGDEHYAMRSSHDFERNSSFVAPIPDSDMLLRTKFLDYFPDRIIKVCCEIRRDNPGPEQIRIRQPLEIVQADEFITKLTADFGRLYLQAKYSDVDIITTDKLRSPAHKAILAVRSSWFAERLDNNKNGEINVEFESSIMRKILNFVYSGKIDMHAVDYIKLYDAANMFKMDDLKRKSKSIVFENIGRSNICQAIVFAYKCKDDEIKAACFEYLRTNFDATLINSDEWRQFTRDHPDIEREVILTKALNQ